MSDLDATPVESRASEELFRMSYDSKLDQRIRFRADVELARRTRASLAHVPELQPIAWEAMLAHANRHVR